MMHNFQEFNAFLGVCVCISFRNVFCDYLSVYLCVITWQKIDQAGEPEIFFSFVLL